MPDPAAVTTTCIKTPAECSASELEAFEVLLQSGGQVTGAGFLGRILGAAHLMFLRDASGLLVGISALKRTPEDYRAKIFQQARAVVLPAAYPLEMGWIMVHPSHRGLGLAGALVEQLLPQARPNLVYATMRADNERIRSTAIRHGFRQEGVAYRSVRGDYDLVLFVQQSH